MQKFATSAKPIFFLKKTLDQCCMIYILPGYKYVHGISYNLKYFLQTNIPQRKLMPFYHRKGILLTNALYVIASVDLCITKEGYIFVTSSKEHALGK